MEGPVSTKKKKKEQNDFPQSLGYTALGTRGINDALNNTVEYHCGQTPGKLLLLCYKGGNHILKAKDEHSSTWKSNCKVQKELISITAIKMYKDRSCPKSHVLLTGV